MRRTHQHRSSIGSRHRTLRHERLEQRQLLAVALADIGGVDSTPDAAEPLSAEFRRLGPRLTSLSLVAELSDGAGADADEPVGELDIPESFDRPGSARNPGDYEHVPGAELGISTPLPEEIDPGKLPGRGCPNGGDPDPPTFGTPGAYERTRELNDYWEDQRDNNVICDALGMSVDAFYNKWLNWYGPRESYDGCPSDSSDDDDGGGSKGDGGKDVSDTDDDVNDKPVKDESGSQPPVKKDPEPEGDDPDEMRDTLMDLEAAAYGLAGGAGGLNGSGLPTRTTGERGEGLGFRLKQESRPGVEDGGPDEMTSPISAAAIDVAIFADFSAYPTPDDDGGGRPPRPEAGQGALRATAEFTTRFSEFAGYDAYPTPDDDGSGPPPPPTA